jgi:hypothetical protein
VTLRRVTWGLLAAGLYLGGAAVSLGPGGLPGRPLYDGLTPPAPYRWVSPPPELAGQNQEPGLGTGRITFLRGASVPQSVFTPDIQAQITFPGEMFPPRGGQRAVRVSMTPLDPATLGPPPAGQTFDGNAYRVEATYSPSGDEASIEEPVSVTLRYARHGRTMLRWDGASWEPLDTDQIRANSALLAESDQLGTFVPAGPPPPPADGEGIRWTVIGALSAAAGALAVGLGIRARRRRTRRRRRPATRRPSPPKKASPAGRRPPAGKRKGKRKRSRRR